MNPKTRSYIEFYKPNDTLFFRDSKLKIDTFLITYMDSITYNPPRIKLWSTTKPFKWIKVHYRQLPIDHLHYVSLGDSGKEKDEDAELIWIFKYNYSSEIYVHFKNLYRYYDDNESIGILKKDTLIVDNISFVNYSDIPLEEDQKWQKDSNYVTNIYWVNKYGIIAYKYRNGDIWKRINLH